MPQELMKGQKYSDRFLKGKLRYQYPVICEEKRDEIRAQFRMVGGRYCEVVSFAGKPLYNLEEQCLQMAEVMRRENLLELDCGIEVNENFDDTYRWVRTKKGIPNGLEGAEVVVLLFDMPGYAQFTQEARNFHRGCIVQRAKLPNFRTPGWWMAYDEADENALYEAVRRRNIEGLMIKARDGLYERTRSWSWFKRKPEETYDGLITGLLEAICGKDQPELGLRVGDKLGRIGSVQVQLDDGSQASPHGIPHDLGRAMFLNPEAYIGQQWCEFSCMEVDRQGGYRHPIFKRLREAKA